MAGQVRLNDFDGDGAVEREVVRLEHHPHATVPYFTVQDVVVAHGFLESLAQICLGNGHDQAPIWP